MSQFAQNIKGSLPDVGSLRELVTIPGDNCWTKVGGTEIYNRIIRFVFIVVKELS